MTPYDHCVFCSFPSVFFSSLESTKVPGLKINFGLCEWHAYTKARTKYGQALKRPQLNLYFIGEAMRLTREALIQLETMGPSALSINLLDSVEAGITAPVSKN